MLTAALCISSVLVALLLATKIFEEVMFRKLKKRVETGPRVGLKDDGGDFVYKQGGFTVKYRVIDSIDVGGKAKIKIIAMKRRIWGYEEKVNHAKKAFRNFLIYRRWVYFFKPTALFLLLSVIVIIYLAGFEPEESKIDRMKWAVARALKIGPDAVTVELNGGVVVSGERKVKGDGQGEDISYNFNLVDWFTFNDAGFISRNSGGARESIAYPVDYYGDGYFRMNKDNKWVEGQYSQGEVRWVRPQGEAGITAEKIHGDGMLRPLGKVLVEDK